MNDKAARRTFIVLAGFLLGLMLWLAPHYGSSGDELKRYEYGKNVLHFYTGIDIGNHLAGHTTRNYLQPYGGLFDATSALLVHFFHPRDEYLLRHYFNVLFGFCGLLLAGLIAREVTGRWRTALLALILLAITPRYWGECFNNPKDIPFAATTLLFVYTLFRWLKHLSALSWKRTLFLAAALMLPLCIRPGGLLFIAYFLLLAAILFLANRPYRNTRFCLHVAVIALVGYFGCLLFWPLAFEAPLTMPFKSFRSQSRYLVAIHVLFEGKMTDCKYLPWYYTHKMLFITFPLITLAGLALSLWAVCRKKVVAQRRLLGLLLCFALFPLVMMIVRGTVLYDGIRQVVFIVALLTICAAIGLESLLQTLPGRGSRIAAGVLMIAGCLLPVRFMAANHPNEYVYYNELVGGMRGAFGNYELDYYMNSVKQAFDWLKMQEGVKIRAAGDSLLLASDCDDQLYYNYNRQAQLPLRIIPSNLFSQHTTDWDYAIYMTRYLDKDALRNGYFNSPKAIHTIYVDGVPICTVLKNDTARLGYQGFVALSGEQYEAAARLTKQAATQYPRDLELWMTLTSIYLKLNRPDEADAAIREALKITRTNRTTVIVAGDIALMRGDVPRALLLYSLAVHAFPGSDAPWLRLAQAQAMIGDMAAAKASITHQQPVDSMDWYRLRETEQLIWAGKK